MTLTDETDRQEPSADARKAYERPQLVEYGEVSVITESGASGALPVENGVYHS